MSKNNESDDDYTNPYEGDLIDTLLRIGGTFDIFSPAVSEWRGMKDGIFCLDGIDAIGIQDFLNYNCDIPAHAEQSLNGQWIVFIRRQDITAAEAFTQRSVTRAGRGWCLISGPLLVIVLFGAVAAITYYVSANLETFAPWLPK